MCRREQDQNKKVLLVMVEFRGFRLLLLHLSKNICRNGWVKVDGVVAETLRRFVALATPALKRFAHPDLCSVAILGVIFDSIHIL